jgi:hypothetical protein
MNTVPTTINIFESSTKTLLLTRRMSLRTTFQFSQVKQIVEAFAQGTLDRLLVEDEEEDWITVSSDTELLEAFKFGVKQNHLNIRAMCTKKPETDSPRVVDGPTARRCHRSMDGPMARRCPAFHIKPETSSQPTVEGPMKFALKTPVTESKPNCTQPHQHRHRAVCDNCHKNICGIRYKCSVCPDYDLCSACEELNLDQLFHPQEHYFLKINTPLHFKRHLKTISSIMQKNNSTGLEERLAAAETRIQSLESKFKACETSRWKRSHLMKQLHEDAGVVCPRRRRVDVTVKTAPSTQDQISLPQENIAESSVAPELVPFIPNEIVEDEPQPEVNLKVEPEPQPIEVVSQPIEEPVVVVETAPQVQEEVSIKEESKEEEEIETPFISYLSAMGFDKASIRKAAERFSDLESAINYLCEEN